MNDTIKLRDDVTLGQLFGWDVERKRLVYMTDNEPVGATPISQAIQIATAKLDKSNKTF